MNISFFSIQPFEKPIYDRMNQDHHHQLSYFEYHLTPEIIDAVAPTDAVCCFVNDVINARVIDGLKAKGVRLIALRSAGYNHVDYAYAQQQGMVVCHVPSYSPEAVAEHAVALILSLNRKIHHAHNRVREGDFSLNGLMGFNLYQKTVGIIGTGKIGIAFARIMNGFGCKLLAFDPMPNDRCRQLGVTYVSLDELLSCADIVSLHCPLTEQTRYLINDQTLAIMKKGVMLINTGRGKLINTKAVIMALKAKMLGYLGIDVYEEEGPLFFDNHSDDIINDDVFCRLLTFPNVLITGHQAFFTHESVENIAKTTLENVTHFENNAGVIYRVP